MKIIRRTLIGFVKAGQLYATALLLFVFMYMFFHDGIWLWVEPNIAMITFEIFLFASWFIGSIIDTVQTFREMKEKKE